GFILDKPIVASALEQRRDAPVFLIDIAVPRNVAPDVNDLEDAYLYDVDDLQSVAADNLRETQIQSQQRFAEVDEPEDEDMSQMLTQQFIDGAEAAPRIVDVEDTAS
ncbi:MAG: glutamyl-tRNA reductase, partial [Proteobacteria bacterium]|nr:glutamyl-tRNA reductase [Pseudomonadota bacterium]